MSKIPITRHPRAGGCRKKHKMLEPYFNCSLMEPMKWQNATHLNGLCRYGGKWSVSWREVHHSVWCPLITNFFRHVLHIRFHMAEDFLIRATPMVLSVSLANVSNPVLWTTTITELQILTTTTHVC